LVWYCAEHSRKLLDWQDRVKVADGAAKGLLYLHENNIIHRDLTTNNILLTHDYEALVIICTVNLLKVSHRLEIGQI